MRTKIIFHIVHSISKDLQMEFFLFINYSTADLSDTVLEILKEATERNKSFSCK